MGEYAEGLAKGDEYILELLSGCPGPMCAKLDSFLPSQNRYHRNWGTDLPKRVNYPEEDDYDHLYSEAQDIAEERDRALEGVEEARSACEALRSCLERVVSELQAYRQEELENPNE